MTALLVSTSITLLSASTGSPCLKKNLDDCCLGDRFAELWHENGDESHRFTFPADAASQKLSRSRLDDAPPTNRDDTAPEYLSH